MKNPPAYHCRKLLRKYRRIQHRLFEATDKFILKRLKRKFNLLARRILRLNRSWKLGIASAALLAWLAGSLQGQNFPASINLADLNGTNGFVIKGINEGDRSGGSVSGAGDINGDGIDDIILGALGGDPDGISYAGESYVVFGSDTGFQSSLSLSDLDGTNGFVIKGIDYFDVSGVSVSGAGDVNADGIDDIIIGASSANPNDSTEAGESYVVFGKSSGFGSSLDLSSLDGNNGFVINGIDGGDRSGGSVSGAGDINGDGIDDIIIGARFADLTVFLVDFGESYVVFGDSTGFNSSLDLSTLDGNNGFVLKGISYEDYSGGSVSGAGDINGDGIDDLVIGTRYADPNGTNLAGESYVVFGDSMGFNSSLRLASLDGNNGFIIEGTNTYDASGRSVSGAGDVNGDGIDDLLIGAMFISHDSIPNSGGSYVVFGRTSAFSGNFPLSSLDGNNGFTLNGVDYYDFCGSSVSGIGDMNGDGIDDLMIGAPRADPGGKDEAGESYVVFGNNAGFGSRLDLENLDGSNGFVINGIEEMDNAGWSVSGAGDINGDGVNDIIIGAPFADPNDSTEAGESYVVFGRRTGMSIVDEVTTLPLRISPNPTSESLHLSSDNFKNTNEIEITLFDPLGREINVPYKRESSDRFRLDLHALPDGTYLLRVVADGKVGTKRVVKR